MSVQAISWVIEHSKHSLGNLIVLFMVANHAKSDGTGAWPSVETLARESRMSERNVRYCLRDLEQSGELLTLKGEGPHGTNLYSLPMMGANIAGAKSYPTTVLGGQNRAGKVSEIAPEPSLNRPKDKKRASIGSFEAQVPIRVRKEIADRYGLI